MNVRALSNVFLDMKTLQSENQLTSLASSPPTFEVGDGGCRGAAKNIKQDFYCSNIFWAPNIHLVLCKPPSHTKPLRIAEIGFPD